MSTFSRARLCSHGICCISLSIRRQQTRQTIMHCGHYLSIYLLIRLCYCHSCKRPLFSFPLVRVPFRSPSLALLLPLHLQCHFPAAKQPPLLHRQGLRRAVNSSARARNTHCVFGLKGYSKYNKECCSDSAVRL